MKKVVFALSVFLFLSSNINAQFHFETGLNVNLPSSQFGQKYIFGIGFFVEPRFALSENLDVGLHLGTNTFIGFGENNDSNDDLDITWSFAVLPTASYRFSNNKISPYVGLSAGMYFLEPIKIGGILFDGGRSSHLGIAPRVGAHLGRINLGMTYNMARDISFFQFNLGVRILNRK